VGLRIGMDAVAKRKILLLPVGFQIPELLIMKSSPASQHFLPQHPVLKYRIYIYIYIYIR